MPFPSKIALLDERFRTRIADLVKDHVSYEDIARMMNAELEEAGLDIRLSTSGVARYGRKLKDASLRLSETQAFARQLALDLGEREGDQTFELMTNMLSHLMFHTLKDQTLEEAEKAFSTGDFVKMSQSLKTLTEARLKDITYRRAVKAEALREAADLSVKAVKEQGLSAEAAGAIKAKILGIRQ